MERLILVPVVFKVIGISGLVYIDLVGPEGFYREVFRRGLVVAI